MKVATKVGVVKKANAAKHKTTTGGGAHDKIFNTVAAMSVRLGKDEVPRKQVAAMSGIKAQSSTFANGLTKLKKEEKITFNSETITITSKGKEAAKSIASTIPVMTTNEECHKAMKEQYKLKGKELDLFKELVDGRAHNTKEVAAAIGCKMNSTFANLKTKMKKFGVIQFDRETIQLTDDMFPFGRP